jgi:hypothetical protein
MRLNFSGCGEDLYALNSNKLFSSLAFYLNRQHLFVCEFFFLVGAGRMCNKHSIGAPYPARKLFIETAPLNLIKTQLKKFASCQNIPSSK